MPAVLQLADSEIFTSRLVKMEVRAHRPLVDEHDRMLRCVSELVGNLVEATSRERWPSRELALLVGCLRSDVLAQAAHEEHELLASGAEDLSVSRLVRDHVRLRAGVDVLARAAEGEAGRSPVQLASTAQGLLAQLRRHSDAEQGLLARVGAPVIEFGCVSAPWPPGLPGTTRIVMMRS